MMPFIRMFIILTLLTGAIYPLFITAVAKIIAPHASRGGLIEHNGAIVGAQLIAQNFKDPKYFWPRPSFINYKPLPSGGSNYALTNALLKKAVDARKAALSKSGEVPNELLFTSGSGLDPHISLNAAIAQIDRVAKTRNFNEEKKALIHRLIQENKTYSYVNVLMLNIALDSIP